MSKPIKYSIVSEAISAISSLNMYPDGEYLEKEKYLSEVDSNASHSVEHINAIIDVSQELRGELNDLKRYVIKDMEYSYKWEQIDRKFREIERRL